MSRNLPLLVLGPGLLACGLLSDTGPTPLPPDALQTAVALTVAALPTATSLPRIAAPPAPSSTTGPSPAPTATPASPEPRLPTETSVPTETPQSGETLSPTPSPLPPEESILILQPGPGSQVINPILVSGTADPGPHQQVIVELVAEDGSIIAQQPATVNADLGQRGPFSVSLPFTGGDQNARIQVSISSARDGGLVHLASVGVQLLSSGLPAVESVLIHAEILFIVQPGPDAVLSGGVVEVSGVGLASFENTLVVEVLDASGAVVGQRPVIVHAPGVGRPGSFSVTVPYTVTTEQPGRVVVKDESVGIPGLIHLASVEVILRP